MQIKSAQEAQAILSGVTAEPQRWMAAINTMVVDLYTKLDALVPLIGRHHQAIPKLHSDLKAIAQAMSGGPAPAAAGNGEQAMVPVAGGPQRGGVRVGADGNPITDPVQLAAEEAMDAAAGPAPGGGAPAPAGGPLIGADGQPITDPAQIAAEQAMNAALG